MRRRVVLGVLAATLAARTEFSAAQVGRLRRIGFVSLLSFSDPPSPERRAFLDGLRELGHVQGKTIEMVYASAEDVPEFLDEITRDLVKQRVDVIVAPGGIELKAAQQATQSIPIVMLAVGDPVGMQLIQSLGRPGGNITGSSFVSSELAGKRVQLLQQVAPLARSVAVAYDVRNDSARLESVAADAAARKLGLAVEMLPFDGDTSMMAALKRAAAGRVHLLYLAFESNIVARRRFDIAAFASAHKLPSISGWSGMADAGVLMTYAPDIVRMFRRGAHYVHRILGGAKPADLPVEQPTRFELVVNLATARAIGVTLPQSIMLTAGRVIE